VVSSALASGAGAPSDRRRDGGEVLDIANRRVPPWTCGRAVLGALRRPNVLVFRCPLLLVAIVTTLATEGTTRTASPPRSTHRPTSVSTRDGADGFRVAKRDHADAREPIHARYFSAARRTASDSTSCHSGASSEPLREVSQCQPGLVGRFRYQRGARVVELAVLSRRQHGRCRIHEILDPDTRESLTRRDVNHPFSDGCNGFEPLDVRDGLQQGLRILGEASRRYGNEPRRSPPYGPAHRNSRDCMRLAAITLAASTRTAAVFARSRRKRTISSAVRSIERLDSNRGEYTTCPWRIAKS